jgi:hypothetical protein
MIHVDESLSADDMHGLEDRLRSDACVVSACTSHEDSHLLLVTYNCDCTSSRNLLDLVRESGVHAELVGL